MPQIAAGRFDRAASRYKGSDRAAISAGVELDHGERQKELAHGQALTFNTPNTASFNTSMSSRARSLGRAAGSLSRPCWQLAHRAVALRVLRWLKVSERSFDVRSSLRCVHFIAEVNASYI